MNTKDRRKQYWLCLAAVLTALAACQSSPERLPIYGQREPVEHMVNGKPRVDTLYQTIPDFAFLNQDSSLLKSDFYKDKIYVANFFFTHCPSICPTMQRNMLKVYEKYKDHPHIAFLSHSIDFKYDQPHVLKAYAQKLGVTNEQWQFVTGSKAAIYGIADKYLVYAREDANAPGGYDHQGYLVLIDKEKRIRGAYDGTEDEQVSKLMHDIDVLFKEYGE